MEQNWNEQLLSFLAASPTAFHACLNLARRLEGEGYTELLEQEDWALQPGGRYFVRRNGSALIAFRIPEGGVRGFLMMAAHSDSPSFKIKEHAAVPTAGMYTRLNVEKYGGMLCASWMDRPLSVAGRAAVRQDGRIVMKLVNIQRDLLLIPHVAIHMDRSANDGKKFDPNTDMLPLFGDSEAAEQFDALIAESLGVQKEDVLATDLFLYPRMAGTVWGAAGEYLSSPRLDDLQCVFGCTEGFLRAETGTSVPVLCVFDNEEVGSGTKQGADSTLLKETLRRAVLALGGGEQAFEAAAAGSFMVSADNAHAAHPNHPDKYDAQNRTYMNKGVVVKHNANQKYTTDGLSAAVFERVCGKAGVPVQRFANRSDIAGGSTLGNISNAQVSMNAVDIGLAQMAMHSARELAGARDAEYMVKALAAFYDTHILIPSDGVVLFGDLY